MQVRSLGQEDALEKEMATHSSILAWRIPWIAAPRGLQSMELLRGRHDWACVHATRVLLPVLWASGTRDQVWLRSKVELYALRNGEGPAWALEHPRSRPGRGRAAFQGLRMALQGAGGPLPGQVQPGCSGFTSQCGCSPSARGALPPSWTLSCSTWCVCTRSPRRGVRRRFFTRSSGLEGQVWGPCPRRPVSKWN